MYVVLSSWKSSIDICSSWSLVCVLRNWFLLSKISGTCAYAGHVSLRAWQNSFTEITVLSNASLLRSLVAQLVLGAELCSVGLLSPVATGSINKQTVKLLHSPHNFQFLQSPVLCIFITQKSSSLKLRFISRTVPPTALSEAGLLRGRGAETKSSIIRHMTGEGEPGRGVSNLISTGMLPFYFILAVLNVAILQFVLAWFFCV